MCKDVTSKKKGNSELYSLYFEEGILGYSQIDITIDPVKNFITKIKFHLTGNGEDESARPILEIAISTYNTNPTIADSFFAETKYVKIDTQGNVSLNKSYSSYKLLTQQVSIH
jgi:hypothetical protein